MFLPYIPFPYSPFPYSFLVPYSLFLVPYSYILISYILKGTALPIGPANRVLRSVRVCNTFQNVAMAEEKYTIRTFFVLERDLLFNAISIFIIVDFAAEVSQKSTFVKK